MVLKAELEAEIVELRKARDSYTILYKGIHKEARALSKVINALDPLENKVGQWHLPSDSGVIKRVLEHAAARYSVTFDH